MQEIVAGLVKPKRLLVSGDIADNVRDKYPLKIPPITIPSGFTGQSKQAYSLYYNAIMQYENPPNCSIILDVRGNHDSVYCVT